MISAEFQPVVQPAERPQQAVEPATDNSVEMLAQRAQVKLWQQRIEASKLKFEPDFKRMRDNMDFTTGLQYDGQSKMDDDRYIVNITNKEVNHKVATLYARNPTAEVVRREQLDYQIWDGNVDTLMPAIEQAHAILSTGQPLPPELSSFFMDVQAGKQKAALIEKVCKTLKITYQYFVDSHKPDFKEQMKQMVRRAIICGVGYVKVAYCADDTEYNKVSSIDPDNTAQARMHRAKAILDKRANADLAEDSAESATLQSLLMSIGASQAAQDETKLPHRLEFDFPMATSILVDPRCRNLKEFVAARWIAQEYILPLAEVNALFQVDIKLDGSNGSGGDATEYIPSTRGGDGNAQLTQTNESDPYARQLVSLYEVLDYNSKTRCFVCKGHKDFILRPEPLFPSVSGFWPIFALTFNDVETDPDSRASVYPPSDVQLIKSAQKEWNRTRDALRDQRNANAPKYLARKGFLTEDDKRNLQNAVPNQVVELEGVPMEQPLDKFIMVMQVAQIDEKVYDTTPMEQDMMFGGGTQAANMGPAQPNVTATVGTIAEQSRETVSASNIDDLDMCLTKLAKAGGEMLLRAFPQELVARVAGSGRAWPEQTREDFVNQIQLKIQAGSSGRPNKAVDIANFRDLAPIMMQAGANPVGVIQEAAKRMDDRIDVMKFFPIQVPGGGPTPQEPGQNQQPESGVQPPSRPQQANQMLNGSGVAPQQGQLPVPRLPVPSLAAA